RFLRDLMRFRTRLTEDPTLWVTEARRVLELLAKFTGSDRSAYSALLRPVVKSLQDASDSYVFHEYLEQVNDPLYFHEFCGRASGKGLAFLGEVNLTDLLPIGLPPALASELHGLSATIVELGQYMDFLVNRALRQTLLCHQHVRPEYTLRPERLADLYIA